jgi:hypothetical protein
MDYLRGEKPAADFVMSRAPVREWATLEAAPERFGYPFGFQLYGTYVVPGEFGYEELEQGVFHEGMVIGSDGGEPIVLDRPGGLRAEVRRMGEVLAQFPETEQVRCFDLRATKRAMR